MRRRGREYPAELDEQHATSIDDVLIVHDADVAVDPELRRAGTPHLEAVLARSPGSFDGAVLALERIRDGVVHAVRATYFDMLATCDAVATDPALRAWAEGLAAPDPLRIGAGRAAAVGITAIVVRTLADGSTGFTLGQRAPELALDPGKWHVVPSGIVDGRGPVATILDELRGEHGITDPGAALDGAHVIAIGYDVARIRPELTIMTRDLGDLGSPEPSDEFVAFREVALELGAIDELWSSLGPDDLTPGAAVAVAAVERHLGGR
jgi:hypothetical protein